MQEVMQKLQLTGLTPNSEHRKTAVLRFQISLAEFCIRRITCEMYLWSYSTAWFCSEQTEITISGLVLFGLSEW